MFKKIKEIKKSNKLKSINDYQWWALDIGTENFKARYINTGLRYDAPTYLAEDYEKNIIIYGEEAKTLMDKIKLMKMLLLNVQFVMVILLTPMLYSAFLLKFFKILDLKLKIQNKLIIIL